MNGKAIEQRVDGKRTMVLGLGASGAAAATLLRALGAEVVGRDVAPVVAAGAALTAQGVALSLGPGPLVPQGAAPIDLLVVSPGVPPSAEIAALEAQGVEVIGEVELASRFLRGQVVAITGTNGKSTVTALVGAMARLAFGDDRCFVGGNLGTPVSGAALGPARCFVLEVSSFQLERVPTFRAEVAVFLNLSADHLDRYPNFEAYAAAKANIFRNQREGDVAVVPCEGDVVRGYAEQGAATVQCFGPKGSVRVESNCLVDDKTGLSIPLADVALKGAHNAENACAAVLAARALKIPRPVVEQVLRTFSGLPHRMAFIEKVDDVAYYDDSKGTNVGAATAAVEGLHGDGKVVLLAGGVDKGGSYAPLADAMARRGRGAVVFGQAADALSSAFAARQVPHDRAGSLEEALRKAAARARPGDAVLLSPACSSFDMFKNYKERGEHFQGAVRELARRAEGAEA